MRRSQVQVRRPAFASVALHARESRDESAKNVAAGSVRLKTVCLHTASRYCVSRLRPCDCDELEQRAATKHHAAECQTHALAQGHAVSSPIYLRSPHTTSERRTVSGRCSAED